MDADQLRDYIIQPTLSAIGLNSPAAVNLLLGTAAQESRLGRYLLQTNTMPYKGGIGIYQMEKRTYDDIWQRKVANSSILTARIKLYLGCSGKPPAERMVSDLALATIMARLYYSTIIEPLPLPNDVEKLAYYWKNYYNTKLGKGDPMEFIKNYRYLVGEQTN